MNFSKPVIAAVALAAALSLTACGSSGDSSADKTTATTTTTTAATEPTSTTPALPTVEELNAQLLMALDPAVPVAEKAELVQGLAADPTLLQQLSEKVAQFEAEGVVTNIQVVEPLTPLTPTQMSVPFTMSFDGQPQQMAVDIVAEDGKWKLAESSICLLAQVTEIDSPACPA